MARWALRGRRREESFNEEFSHNRLAGREKKTRSTMVIQERKTFVIPSGNKNKSLYDERQPRKAFSTYSSFLHLSGNCRTYMNQVQPGSQWKLNGELKGHCISRHSVGGVADQFIVPCFSKKGIWEGKSIK